MNDPKPRRSTAQLVGLPALAPLPTAAERAAEVIRENIFEGRFPPGSALPEAALAQALQVSRNTVREAFRTLMSEHLLEYEVHKGVAVRRLTPDDARDIYEVRRTLELSALDRVGAGLATVDGDALTARVEAGLRAAENDDWVLAGTANLHFHAQIVGLHGSPRLDQFFHRLMTEMRLGFLAIDDPKALHEPYLAQNQEICACLIAGRVDQARAMLDRYLTTAMERIVDAVASA
jgi:DNA-binding GntR family transcriptional regulator